jgi:signal transduction histidine kinase
MRAREPHWSAGPSAILVVDDDPRNLLAVQATLGEEHELVLAQSGSDALRLLLERDFAVVLLDVMMPNMDGFETARLIRARERSRDTPIIFVTAHRDDDEKVREGYALGAVDFLFKPVVTEVLSAKVSVFVALQERTRKLQMLERRAHEQRLAEERQRWAAEALRIENARKDDFLAVLAHELRNPLTPVLLSLRLLREGRLDTTTVSSCVDAMDRQVRHLMRLVDDLLDVSRITSGKIELRPVQTTLAAVVTQALEATQPLLLEKGHQMEVVEASGVVPMVADADRLSQVVSNLVSNAARYTERGGRVRVAYGGDELEGWVRVEDNGRGIEASALPHVFDMYYQAEGSHRVDLGLGLGLAVAKKLINLHGGSITARSQGPGRGSTFEIRLPVGELSPPTPIPAPQLRTEREGAKILVVDDNDDVRLMTAELLRSYGHRVDQASDGQTAVELAVADPPDLILLDLGMPGMDGFATAKLLRERMGDRIPPLVALSGFGSKSDRQKTTEAAFAVHLLKPVDPDQLLTTLDRVLHSES